jgi:DNA processing protein
MKDKYYYLWAQWGILTCDRHNAIITHFGDLETAWHKITPQFMSGLRMNSEQVKEAIEVRNRISFEQTMDIVKAYNVKLLYIEDDDYPENLKHLSKPPPFLYVRGKLPSFQRSLAVVGTRAHSDYGRHVTEDFVSDLVRQDFVVVSGLAFGIDSIAHRRTIRDGGITVAVLASGVDKITPSSNYNLGMEILESDGAIVSTFPLGTIPQPKYFPRRNMIIAGLTKGTLVIEGGSKSGALITAKNALDEGREVFAIPERISNFKDSGTNKYIRESRAKLVENIEHIMESFGMNIDDSKKIRDFNEDEKIILDHLALDGKTMDQLFRVTEFNIPQLSYILVTLQLKKVVRKEGVRWFVI